MKKTAKAANAGRDRTLPPANFSPALGQRLGAPEYWPIDRPIPYADNPRKHSERQIVALMASISEFGIALPFIADEHGVLICGHARLEAARRLGIQEVPVLVASSWSKAQVQAYRLTDNRLSELASWDSKLLAVEIAAIIEIAEVPIEILGWSTGEIDVILDCEAAAYSGDGDVDNVIPEIPSVPISKIGDLWHLGRHRLLCGSCLDADNWERLMAGRLAAMSLNDPPWNVPVNGHVSSTGRHAEFAFASGEMTSAEFIAFNANWLSHATLHIKDGAIVMAFIDHAHLYELMTASRRAELEHINLCVWAKTNGGQGGTWRSQCEFVLVLKCGSAPHTNTVEMGKHGRYRTTLWTYPGANAFGATRDVDLADHPTVKPRALLVEAIRDVTRQGEIVVDAFSGSGSTILACERSKRIGYAMEIEPRYVDVAIRRWEEATGLQATLEGGDQTFVDVRALRAISA